MAYRREKFVESGKEKGNMGMKWEKWGKNLEKIFCSVEFQKSSHLIFLEKKKTEKLTEKKLTLEILNVNSF